MSEPDLRVRRDALAERVAQSQFDLGGLTYEMAIRDHFRLDVLVRRAAALQQLEALGLVRPAAHEASVRGPNRTVLQLTPSGRRALARWLLQPVEHVRDVRSVLLLKLALFDRGGQDPAPLLAAQREVVDAIIAALRRRRTGADGFDAVLATWRLESARAVLRFLDAVAKRSAW